MDLKIEQLPVEALTPYAHNTRAHHAEDVGQIARSIERNGFNDPIAVWSDKNIIVEGHGRLMAAKSLGMTTVPVIRLDHLTDDQRREYGIMHNKTAELSDWDWEQLEHELAEINLSEFGLAFTPSRSRTPRRPCSRPSKRTKHRSPRTPTRARAKPGSPASGEARSGNWASTG